MRLNIEVDLDFIGEDGSIDEEVKFALIQGVKNAISTACMKDMEDKSKAAFSEAVSAATRKIEERALAFADEWLSSEKIVTDKWGDPLEKVSMSDLIKRSFDNLLERKVDSNGMFDSTYNGKMRLVDYLSKRKVEDEVISRMKDFQKEIDSKIDAAIKSSIKENVSDRFAQMVIGAAKQDYLEAKALEAKA